MRICILPSGTYRPPPAEIKTSNWNAAAGWDFGDTSALHPVWVTDHMSSTISQTWFLLRIIYNDMYTKTLKRKLEQISVGLYPWFLMVRADFENSHLCEPQHPKARPSSRESTAADGYLKHKHRPQHDSHHKDITYLTNTHHNWNNKRGKIFFR